MLSLYLYSGDLFVFNLFQLFLNFFYCPDALGKISLHATNLFYLFIYYFKLFVVAGVWYAKLNVCIYVVPSLFLLFVLTSLPVEGKPHCHSLLVQLQHAWQMSVLHCAFEFLGSDEPTVIDFNLGFYSLPKKSAFYEL